MRADQHSLMAGTLESGSWAPMIELLASDDPVVRCGGLLGLEHFARMGHDPVPVYGVVCAFARQRTPRDRYRAGPDPDRPQHDARLIATAASQRSGDYELAVDVALRSGSFGYPGCGLDLRGCLITERRLAGIPPTDFSGAMLSHCTFAGPHEGHTFNRARLEVVTVEEARISACQFDGAQLCSSLIRASEIDRASFVGSVWDTMTLSDSMIAESNLSGAQFENCRLAQATLRHCALDNSVWMSETNPRLSVDRCSTTRAVVNGRPW